MHFWPKSSNNMMTTKTVRDFLHQAKIKQQIQGVVATKYQAKFFEILNVPKWYLPAR